ncbi:hypothetical protein OsJ_14173 [Oryza sativa Japonica Group]|nr:hypothetical protein OsJ_14173 [Oryza sativa Japonica Group]
MSRRHRHYPDPEVEDHFEDSTQDEPSNSLVTSTKESKGGRGPNVLMAPVPEKDRAVITPLNKDAWITNPMKKNVSSTITCLIKAHYPGTYRPLDKHGKQVPEDEAVVIAHYHNFSAHTRITILKEFLLCFKFADGREEDCARLFYRKAVERFSQALSHEKSEAKRSLEKHIENMRATELQQDGDAPSHDDFDVDEPQLWKAFPPYWIEQKWWDMLCDLWSDENVKKVSAQNSKNRMEGGGVHHTCGSRSVAMHKQAMIIENAGTDVDDIDVFERTHRHAKGKGQWCIMIVSRKEKTIKSTNNMFGCSSLKVENVEASAPSGSMETQPLYTQQQVQDIVQQAVTNAVNNAHQELASRIERLEQTVDKDKAETHSHDANGPSSSVVPEFLHALLMNGMNTTEEAPQAGHCGRTCENDDLWRF